jgi:copper transport protein
MRPTIEANVRGLSAGTHTVRWRVVSEDGHPIDGTFQFSVNAASGVAAPLDQDVTAGTGAVEAVAGRALHLLGLGWILGPIALFVIMQPLTLRMHRRLWRLIFFGTLTVIGAGVLMFVAQSSAVNGSFADGLQWAAITSLLSSRWGRLWSYRMLVDLVLMALALGAWRRGAAENLQSGRVLFGVSAFVAGVLLLFTAMNGHSAATQPVWLSLSVDWLHLVATAVWIGGLGVLAVAVLPAIRRMPRDQRDAALGPLMRRFSTLALVCVELLLFTGLYHAWAHVDAPSSLTSTQYGQALLAKLGLVAAMMLPAAINLFVLKPRLEDDSPVLERHPAQDVPAQSRHRVRHRRRGDGRDRPAHIGAAGPRRSGGRRGVTAGDDCRTEPDAHGCRRRFDRTADRVATPAGRKQSRRPLARSVGAGGSPGADSHADCPASRRGHVAVDGGA